MTSSIEVLEVLIKKYTTDLQILYTLMYYDKAINKFNCVSINQKGIITLLNMS